MSPSAPCFVVGMSYTAPDIVEGATWDISSDVVAITAVTTLNHEHSAHLTATDMRLKHDRHGLSISSSRSIVSSPSSRCLPTTAWKGNRKESQAVRYEPLRQDASNDDQRRVKGPESKAEQSFTPQSAASTTHRTSAPPTPPLTPRPYRLGTPELCTIKITSFCNCCRDTQS